jgi:hypothetical protein
MNPERSLRCFFAALITASGLFLTGCGMEAAPQPPSLNLPNPVVNLTAVRTSNRVALAWTMPKRTTDKLLIKGNVTVSICRREAHGPCVPIGSLSLAPAAAGSFKDTLPPAQATGAPRPLAYYIELKNRKNRSAGPSNPATVLAGQAPAPVTGLTATVSRAGVILGWDPITESMPSSVRLMRTLLSPPPARPSGNLLAPPPAPIEEKLLVSANAQPGPLDRALDKTVHFGQVYQYRAQRVARVTLNGQTLELDGPLSLPVRVDVQDIFPPAVPTGLAAVANAPAAGTPASIDLSWLPDAEADLAGYIVYRREGAGPWQRISPAQPVAGPAFHDAHVEPGHTYTYAVTAISLSGHESARSAPAEETVPTS